MAELPGASLSPRNCHFLQYLAALLVPLALLLQSELPTQKFAGCRGCRGTSPRTAGGAPRPGAAPGWHTTAPGWRCPAPEEGYASGGGRAGRAQGGLLLCERHPERPVNFSSKNGFPVPPLQGTHALSALGIQQPWWIPAISIAVSLSHNSCCSSPGRSVLPSWPHMRSL